VAERLAIGTESWVAAFTVRVADILALKACYDTAGEELWRRSCTSEACVANGIAALAVVVRGTSDGTGAGNTVASLVTVTVLLLGSVVLLLVLVLLLILVLALLVVAISGLLVIVTVAVRVMRG